MKKLVMLVTFLMVATWVTPARSGDLGLTVRARIASVCSVTASGDLDFGPAAPGATQVPASTLLTPSCNGGTFTDLGFGNGLHSDLSSRRMAMGGARLAYQLFRQDGATEIGLIQSGSSIWRGLTGGADVTLYGRIPVVPLAQAAGDYSDTVLVSVGLTPP